jgi:simple sugar transport system substrate-binding protein
MRDPRRARWGAALAAGTLAVALAAPVGAQDGVQEIGYIAPEPATDFGWNEQGLVGTQGAAETAGATVIQADGSGYEDIGPVLNQMAEDGADFVVAQASGYATQASAWAAETGIPVIVYDNPGALAPGQVVSASTAGEEGGYLAGVLAGSQTQTGVLGIVLSAANDINWLRQAGGFVAGARSVNPDVTFQKAIIDEFGYADTEGGNRVTTQLIAAGADIIFGMGDGSSFGMLQAIENNVPEGAEQAWFIDVIGDKTSIDEQGVLLSSVLWDFQGIYERAIAEINAGTYGTENYVMGIEDGSLDLLMTPHIQPETATAVETAKAAIVAGEIEPPVTESQEALDALIAGEATDAGASMAPAESAPAAASPEA